MPAQTWLWLASWLAGRVLGWWADGLVGLAWPQSQSETCHQIMNDMQHINLSQQTTTTTTLTSTATLTQAATWKASSVNQDHERDTEPKKKKKKKKTWPRVTQHNFCIVYDINPALTPSPSLSTPPLVLAWMLGWLMCKFVPYIQGVSVAASVYSLIAVSLDR